MLKNRVLKKAEISPYGVFCILAAMAEYEKRLTGPRKDEYEFESRTIRNVLGAYQFSGMVVTEPEEEKKDARV